jgi:hypothetical protein
MTVKIDIAPVSPDEDMSGNHYGSGKQTTII